MKDNSLKIRLLYMKLFRYLTKKIMVLKDKLKGLDFISQIEPEEVGLNPALSFRSEPSGNIFLEDVLNDLNITSKDAIIDIGCGKGDAMRTMLKYPFYRVDGIELSEVIASIAIKNFKILHEHRCKIFIQDASLFCDYDSYTYIYFYNPFPVEIMSKVMQKIILSINNRRVILIYDNPTCHNEIIKNQVFTKICDYPDARDRRIFVYSTSV